MISRQFFRKTIPRVRLKPNSIRTQLGFALGGITFLLAFVSSAIMGQVVQRHIQEDNGQYLAELAYQVADKLDRGMFERYRDIQIRSTREEFINPQTPASRQREVLETLQKTYPDYAWIGFADRSGIVRASTDKLLEGEDISQRPWFIHGQKRPFISDVHEARLLAKLIPNSTGEPLRFVDIAVPVVDNQGNHIGVLAAYLTWEWARNVENSSLRFSQSPFPIEMFVVSQEGKVLLAPRTIKERFQKLELASVQAAHQGKIGHRVETGSDGKTYVTGFAPTVGYRDYPGLGWVVLLRKNTEIAFAPARKLQQQILGWGFGFGLLLFWGGWLMAGRITNPLQRLAEAAEQFRQGDRNVKITQGSGQYEVNSLGQSLTSLFKTLSQQEQALKTVNESLEQRVQERTRELSQTNATLQTEISDRIAVEQKLKELTTHLQRTNQELEQFSFAAAHDLQEPLRMVVSYTQLLAQDYQHNFDESAHEYMGYVVEGSKRMQQLIQDWLTYSRLGSGSQKLAPTDCNEVLRQVLENLQEAIAATNATITYNSLPTLIANKNQLIQLFQNLIENAIKFHRQDDFPQVSINTELKGDKWFFSLHDNGIGIKPQYLKRIFVLFKRLHTHKKFSGTGMGLAICKKIVERHGGRIWAESQPGVGTTFYFTIPINPEPSNELS
ncbi:MULTISPECIES: ATP-binding protein [unclassified Coleofasciculus]|uniref:ATP-binding protein n=1 Tax=unclassified Coleofasciculus TaxID=2692782 RepID=UPI00187F8609|nr:MULTISPECIES: ATP-binding protein [unclassified Coleofasciculus]MBE9126819.1 HAMP domain-containing protein [Coleofasciculus sp. LEGE 07081]MBE9150190.1 HAMP domain-containing protein [Coleofasciculus sp. LEGE 07092]